MKIQNISKRKIAATGIPQFDSLEIREVTNNEAEILLANSNFIKVSETKKTETKTIKDDSENEPVKVKSVNYKKINNK